MDLIQYFYINQAIDSFVFILIPYILRVFHTYSFFSFITHYQDSELIAFAYCMF